MRLVTEDPETLGISLAPDRYVLFTSGDGRHELRVCRGFIKQFDGNDIYVLNLKPPSKQTTTGFASLQIVRYFVERHSIKSLAWTCDKEHIKSLDDWIDEIKKQLTSMGMAATVRSVWIDAASFELTLGAKRAILWCALLGIENKGFLEENLAELIDLEFHETVACDKHGVLSALRRRDLTIEELIIKAKKSNLKSALASLCFIFEDIEQKHRAP